MSGETQAPEDRATDPAAAAPTMPASPPAPTDTVGEAPPAAVGDGQWYRSFAQQMALWSGPDSAAVVFALVPQWSLFHQLAPQQGGRISVRYFGNSVAQAGTVWVDADHLGPVPPPADPSHVQEPEDTGAPLAPPPVDHWYQNRIAQVTLWSG